MSRLSLPKDKIKVLLLEGVHQSAIDTFQAHGYVNVTRLPQALAGAELIRELDGVHMLGIRSGTHLIPEVLESARRLMAVGCFCIGTNQVDLGSAARLGIPVFNAPHSNTRSVAELVLAETVMLLRGTFDKSVAAHRGEWHKTAAHSHEVRGKTLGIVGYGHIGSQVSILAEAFGMRVVYQDIVSKLPMGNATQLASLDELLPLVDVLTLHVPEDPSTKNLIDARRLSLMRPGSYLINASRGTVVDVDALAVALREGRLQGAAIDVFPEEPGSSAETFRSPLQGLRNVILTPHVGGSTLEAQKNIGGEVASKLVALSDTGATVGAVNFPQLSLAPHDGAHRLLHVHHNRPGVLAQLNQALARSGANILGQHLQTTAAIGYVVTDVDKDHGPDLRQQIEEIPGTIRVRILY